MTDEENRAVVAEIRRKMNEDLAAFVREGFASGRLKRGCKNARLPKTINKSLDRVPIAKPKADLTSLLRRPLACIHLGPILRKCALNPQLGHTYLCNKFQKNCGRTTHARKIEICCETCDSYQSLDRRPWPLRFDEKTLWRGVPGKRFNASIIEHDNGYLMACRNGWAGSDIYVGKLDNAFRPVGQPKRLDLKHRRAKYGREDPRLFRFRGQLHISYIGCVGTTNPLRTHQLYARLTDDLRVEKEFAPRLRVRQWWEKNWTFFEHDEQLHAIYSISPYRVIRIDGEDTADVLVDNQTLPWSGGVLRGGASPVRVGDEWYCFFHGKIAAPEYSVYNTGVFVFQAKPPFRIVAITPHPIDVANIENKPDDQWCPVLFCGGAVRHGTSWVTANGIHDRWTELRQYHGIEHQLHRLGE